MILDSATTFSIKKEKKNRKHVEYDFNHKPDTKEAAVFDQAENLSRATASTLRSFT